ncbi:30S ribosomal protein S18 [Streptomyces sp. NPDC090022]|uniref:30S ribosomal protein S18 n=1 Tax=Streptomyces sp. NPDC090022 TaxID=3365920 RepID=UPI0037F17925
MGTRRNGPRKPLKSRPNPLDAAGITYIDYKDTDLLRKFISDRGKIRSRRVTRVTRGIACSRSVRFAGLVM